jgi:parallel beta-helix repeat protein
VKKSPYLLALLLLVSVVLLSFLQIEVVKAEGTIYIRADGSVEGTDKIQRNENIYTLTGSIYDKRMIVEKSNIIIDGNGQMLSGQGAIMYDLYLFNVEGVTIKNMVIKGGLNGIFVEDCIYVTISGNKITEIGGGFPPNPMAAIILRHGGFHRIVGNTIVDNFVGIHFSTSSNNRIYDNNFINNQGDLYDPGWYYPQTTPSTYFLDDGLSGGNYWSNYKGTDSDGDGIGDTPYIYKPENETLFTDNYPLMNPVPAIPEFPSWTIIPSVLIATFALLLFKKRLSKRKSGNYL